MPLKTDEIFVRDCIVKHLGPNIVSAQEGEDPPDIYLMMNKEKFAVEITRLSPVSFDEKGDMQNRNNEDIFGVNLCNELDSKLKSKVPDEIDIVLAIHVPVDNPLKYKKELKKQIEVILEKKTGLGSKHIINVLGHRVDISIIPNRTHSEKKIVGVIVNDNSNAHILSYAEVILSDRIQDKVEKCKNIPHKGKKWLALLNDYWLADNDTYSQAIKNISVQHDFEKIYLISVDGTVSELVKK
jgi:hypothetical protein